MRVVKQWEGALLLGNALRRPERSRAVRRRDVATATAITPRSTTRSGPRHRRRGRRARGLLGHDPLRRHAEAAALLRRSVRGHRLPRRGTLTCSITNRSSSPPCGSSRSGSRLPPRRRSSSTGGASPFDAVHGGDRERAERLLPVSGGHSRSPWVRSRSGGYRPSPCGLARESPSPTQRPFPVTSPRRRRGPSPARSSTSSSLDGPGRKEWAGAHRPATLFVDATASRLSTPPRSRPPAARALLRVPRLHSGRGGRDHRPCGFTATIDCGRGPRLTQAARSGLPPPPSTAPPSPARSSTPPDDRAAARGVGRRGAAATIFVDNVGRPRTTCPGRRRRRAERVLRLSAVDAGHSRRDRRPGGLRRRRQLRHRPA